MVSTVSLRGLLLLFLLSQSAEQQTVNMQTLGRIIRFFDQNYQTFSVENDPQQYAVAINVDETQCKEGFEPTQNNFLNNESPDVQTSHPLYTGQELIVAGVKKLEKYSLHAERLLLTSTENLQTTTPMEDLLNKRKEQSCTIFYTYKSPCVKTCLNELSDYNILAGLENWGKHSSMKAFVFKNIFWVEKDPEVLQRNFKKIVAHVPLYRCDSENECYACNGEGDTAIDQHCLVNTLTKEV